MDPETADTSRGSHRPVRLRTMGQITRRSFVRWAGLAVVGASAVVGKLVGFAPSVVAATISCFVNDQGGRCTFSCISLCDNFSTCCPNNSELTIGCCCQCNAGPGNCTPKHFRAKGVCKANGNVRCCCVTC